MIHDPPKRALRFLEWFCPNRLFEGIEGDLLEQFDEDIEQLGQKKANRKFWWNVLRFFRPSIITRNNYQLKILNTMMLSNYFKITTRTMMKSKLYSFINAFGLSIGMAFCMLIYLYIQDEKSFDQFHVNKDQIYRIDAKMYNSWRTDKGYNNMFNTIAHLQTPVGPTLKEELAEVVMATRYNNGGEGVVTYKDKVFTETLTYVDLDFFHMFSFELYEGSIGKIFTDQYEVVITPEIAHKYFGNEDPINKVIEIDREGSNSYTVTGVIAPATANSSLTYNILINQKTRPYYQRNNEQWGNFGTPTFVKLVEEVNFENFDKNLSNIVDKYMGESIDDWNIPEELSEEVKPFEYKYKKLSDIHLDTEVSWFRGSDPQYSFILGAIAILILLIACINYVSLALTTSVTRRIEVGVRKAIGASRSQVIYQFTFEAISLAIISMVIGMGLLYFFLPSFNEFTKKEMVLDLYVVLELIGIGIAVSILVGIIAGSYPSFMLSRFNPAKVLKSGFLTQMKGGFAKPLVVIQFALSAFLIVSSVIMYQQMQFVTTKDLGYNKEQILVIPTQTGWNINADKTIKNFRQVLNRHLEVISVAGTSSSFNRGYSLHGYEIDGEQYSSYVYSVDAEYLPTLDIKLIEGRNFDNSIASDTTAVIVNEALVDQMGWKSPIEEHLNWRDDSIGLGSKVIGVVKNFHFRSLENKIEPMHLSMNKESTGYLINMLIKIDPKNIPQALETIEQEWKTLYPDRPFDYKFLDEDIDHQYESYARWMNIMGLATGFAILISCLGLFGISGINALNRTKEIGIRKVMGAELSNIFILLNKQYVWLAIIAFAAASPISWYVMNIWLSDFEFAITIGWPVFVVSMLVGLFVALSTVSYHAVKTALVNPADTLKYE